MQDKIDPLTGLQASILIANVGINKAEAAPLMGRHAPFNFLKIRGVTGREIIKTDDVLVEFQQSLRKISADQTGGPGNEPLPGGIRKLPADLLIARQSLHMRKPASRMAVRSNTDLTSINTPCLFNRDKSSRNGIVR